jgi:hypothetical protein
MAEFTPEQSEEQMRAWTRWMGRTGSSLVDGGAPFGARALLDGHPFLSEGKGRFAVEVFELVPMWRYTGSDGMYRGMDGEPQGSPRG